MRRSQDGRTTNYTFRITAGDVYGEEKFNIFDAIRTKVLKSYNRGLNIPVTSIVFTEFDTEYMCLIIRIMWTKSTDSMLLAKEFADNSGITTYSLFEILKRGA